VLVVLIKTERINLKRFIPRARVEEFWDGKERRRHVRFKKALDVTYKVEKKPHLKNGRTVDISEGGMKLLIDEKLFKGAILDLEVELAGTGTTAEVEGEVVWSEDSKFNDGSGKRYFASGIQFIAIKEPSGSRLIDYIRSLPADTGT
jgi:c-di-GMP-binding flagellar brake protein YcgR